MFAQTLGIQHLKSAFLSGSVKFVAKAAAKAVSERKMWVLSCRATERTGCSRLARPGAVAAAGPDPLSAPSPLASEQLLLPGASVEEKQEKAMLRVTPGGCLALLVQRRGAVLQGKRQKHRDRARRGE